MFSSNLTSTSLFMLHHSNSFFKFSSKLKKIELKKEIKDMFPMLKERSSNLAYKIELYDDNELFLRRVKEIKEKAGDLPILLTFQREYRFKSFDYLSYEYGN